MSLPITTVFYYVGAVCLLVVFAILARPVIWPTILTFPYESTEKDDQVVVLAGSYNPPHLGHLAMLEYLSKRYRRVIAVVGFNPNKKYLVTPEQRKELLQNMVASSSAKNIEVEVVEGYIWRFAKRKNATIFFRGIRSWDVDGADERALQILNTWGPVLLGPLAWPIPTMYLEGNPKFNHVSSTLIRTLCSKGTNNKEALSELVPSEVATRVGELYCAKED